MRYFDRWANFESVINSNKHGIYELPLELLHYSLVPSLPPTVKFFVNIIKKTAEKKKLNFSRSALFHIKTRVCLKYFVNGRSFVTLLRDHQQTTFKVNNKCHFLKMLKPETFLNLLLDFLFRFLLFWGTENTINDKNLRDILRKDCSSNFKME